MDNDKHETLCEYLVAILEPDMSTTFTCINNKCDKVSNNLDINNCKNVDTCRWFKPCTKK